MFTVGRSRPVRTRRFGGASTRWMSGRRSGPVAVWFHYVPFAAVEEHVVALHLSRGLVCVLVEGVTAVGHLDGAVGAFGGPKQGCLNVRAGNGITVGEHRRLCLGTVVVAFRLFSCLDVE